MTERTFVIELGTAVREAVLAKLGEPLRRVIPDDAMRNGLLEGLVLALSDRREGTVPVTMRTTPACVEVEIVAGGVRDTLVCTV